MDTDRLLIRRPNGLLLHRSKQSAESCWREDTTYKFLFSPNGSISCQTHARSFTLQPEQFLILHPHLPHQQLGYEREKFLIELSSRFLHDVAESIGITNRYDIQFALVEQKHPRLTQWVRFSIDYLSYNTPQPMEAEEPAADTLFLDHAFVQLVILLLQNAAGSHTYDLTTRHLKSASPLLFAVIDAMKQHYTHAWTLQEMAQTADMNKYQFAHLFKETVGISPYSWLQLYRLVKSQQLLKNTDQNILEIALNSGFSSLTVYNQLFKRIYGVSPSAFRKRYK